MKIKFKHNKKSTMKALNTDLSVKDVNVLVNKAMQKFMTDDDKQKLSHLAEIIHNALPYEAILYIAVQGIKDRVISESLPSPEKFAQMLDKIFTKEPKKDGDASI